MPDFPIPPSIPPDQAERSRALDLNRSFLVQAPAGSGKTFLLTQRFLSLLAQAEKPDEIVAITFTNAAAAEMRNRVLDALENTALKKIEAAESVNSDPESLPALAAKALERSQMLGWQLLDQPSQLRITTIDAFCRGLALRSPLSWGGLLSGLGGRLDPVDSPGELYRRAATRTLEILKDADSPTRRSIEQVLLWRDNNWKDVEDLIVDMLAVRSRWHREFVFARDEQWQALREVLETPFRRAAQARLNVLGRLFEGLAGSLDFALTLARSACEEPGKSSPLSLAERAELPTVFSAGDSNSSLLEDALDAYRDLACFLLTAKGEWRKKGGLNATVGFPATPAGRAAKDRFATFVEALAEEPGLQSALASCLQPIPVRYTDDEWELIRHCFAVLRVATAQLQVVFAETGSVDFTEIARIALDILAPEDGYPSDFAQSEARSIRHLLIDEFQDTSRSQHELLSRLVAAWPEREGRSCFCVGDPMQSIYGFREAEVELFDRVRTHGLEIYHGLDAAPLHFDFVPLRANFRTVPALVDDLNLHFHRIFAEADGSGISFSPAEAARPSHSSAVANLHLAFTRTAQSSTTLSSTANSPSGPTHLPQSDSDSTRQSQLNEIVTLIRGKLSEIGSLRSAAIDNPHTAPTKYRIAVLGRTKSSLIRIAKALQEAGIAFRALELVPLRQRPEVLDALALARALLNPVDRTAWLGVLRAPWCGLSLAELHLLTSADEDDLSATPISILLQSRPAALFEQGHIQQRAYAAVSRVERILRHAIETRASGGGSSLQTLGTWLASVWRALGGDDTVNAEQCENLRLLWAALDALPGGELDLLGPGLNAALDKLCAQPDPAASSDFGVQLMTIHKSKGLEFETVIVPDLEADGRKSERTMISWLERGLAVPQSANEIAPLTEFLIAPIQSKGTEAGLAKKWVDSVKREREKQELRRLLYVAATRAREELHLFARPRFKVSSTGEASLSNPTGLLATAWPAFGDEIESRFAYWWSETSAFDGDSSETKPGMELASLAAQAEPTALIRPTMLRRLPEDYAPPELPRQTTARSHHIVGDSESDSNSHTLYERTAGGLRSRMLGEAVHRLLEHLSQLRRTVEPQEAASALADFLPAITAGIRSHGLIKAAAGRMAAEALVIAQQSATHPLGAWILTPHPESEAESRWTGLIQASLSQSSPSQPTTRNLRPDRVFLAPIPLTSLPGLIELPDPESADPNSASPEAITSTTEPVWWIIDYKTAHRAGINRPGMNPTGIDPAVNPEILSFLHTHRDQYGAQLAAYAQLLRGLRSAPALRIRAGIFYPRLQILHHWQA